MSRKLAFVLLALLCTALIYAIPTIAVGCSGLPGDANDDGQVIGGDVTFLVNYLHLGGKEPPCPEQADANGDCVIDDADIVYLINYFSGQGPAPTFCRQQP